jgi:hypothetical protein
MGPKPGLAHQHGVDMRMCSSVQDCTVQSCMLWHFASFELTIGDMFVFSYRHFRPGKPSRASNIIVHSACHGWDSTTNRLVISDASPQVGKTWRTLTSIHNTGWRALWGNVCQERRRCHGAASRVSVDYEQTVKDGRIPINCDRRGKAIGSSV